MHIYVYVYTHVYICIYTCIYMYICTYAHRHTRYLGAGEAEPVRGSVNAPYHMHNTMNHMQNKTQ